MYRVLTCLGGEHDWRLVVLAGAVCFLASFTAVSLFHRARATHGRVRLTWIITAGTATGCGIWATHFIAMLAYEPGVATAYSVSLTVLSLIAAVTVTSGGLYFAVNGPPPWSPAVAGGIVGAGVACMHYIGMSALELQGRVTWSLDLVLASIVLGIVFGTAALAVAVRRDEWRGTLLAALLLTLAILSHHFTAMGAVEIVPDPTRVIEPYSLSDNSLAIAIAAIVVSVLGMCLVGALSDRRSKAQLHAYSVQLDTALNNMVQGLCMFDAAEGLVLCNQRYIQMYGLSPELTKAGRTLRELLAFRAAAGTFTGDPEQYRSELRAAIDQGQTKRQTTELADGRTISVVNQPMAGGGWVATHEDTTERRKAEKELNRTRTFLNTVIENVPATLLVKDAHDRRYVLVNRSGEEFFGVSRDEMIGKTAHQLFSKSAADEIVARDTEALQSRQQLLVHEHPVETPRKGVRHVISKRLVISGDDGKPQYLLGVLDDVTERKRDQERIAHMAHHDALTDLPNRAAFTERLAFTLERAATSGESFAVLCIDLDRYKEVNDLFGHSVGDAVLREMSKRMLAAAEGAFLARLGGDEFTFISADVAQPSSAAALADRILTAATEDMEVEGSHLQTSLSIGVAVYPADGRDATTLLANADAALYRAKAEGRGSIRFFEADMDKRLRERRALQHDLRSAIANGDFGLHYQPQALIEGRIIGFEALARWRHPSRGMVPPATFIPLAEENGLIIPISEWILREACREAASWPRPLQIAVNLSPVQFRRGDLPGLIHSVLLETGLAPHRLELEITESVLIDDFSRAISILLRIKSLGVRIAMDDFGTGYSSLSYLQAFAFDKIKIDKSFIANIDQNHQSATIVHAVIGLARGLALPVVAEGVETQAELAFLSQTTCDQVQGYFVGRPEPIESYAEVIGRKSDQPRRAAALA
jgi:diguanylate cyclase (GGDEF)-like protein/PAS domain S-box-containing protein